MLEVVPITLKEANAFVEQNHRHHGPTVGHKFSIGLSDGEKIVGVAIVGRPVARHLDDGWTLEVNRLGWLYGGGSAKEDIQDNLSVLRQRCRDLYMGVPLATGALKTCRTNVVGSGLRLKSQLDYEVLGIEEEAARDLERKIEREFSLWADSTACDLERLDNFYELQQLAFLNWLMSGDVIATLPVTKRTNCPYDLRICLIEADRLSNPNGIVTRVLSAAWKLTTLAKSSHTISANTTLFPMNSQKQGGRGLKRGEKRPGGGTCFTL